jgi:membrane protein implicated in regulation of membrane protease activity
MPEKFNLRLLLMIVISMLDEAVIVVVILVVLSLLGIHLPLWLILLISLAFLLLTFAIYRLLKRSPQLGFENVIGLEGRAVDTFERTGTVRIKGALWSVESDCEKIEAGAEIKVIGQTGLKLKVTNVSKLKELPPSTVLTPKQ